MPDPNYYYHLEQIQQELDSYERGAEQMERQMDKLIDENRELRRQLDEANLEIIRLRSL